MTTPLRLLCIALLFFSFQFQTSAQDCGTTGRYKDSIFETVTKTTGILFGRNSATKYGSTAAANTDYPAQDLLLDFYQPAGDPAVKRPLVILAFGGGYVSGSRTDMDSIATAFAKKGYAAAAIDYRLINTTVPFDLLPLLSAPDARKLEILRDVIIKASADVRAAVRFFKHDAATANTYRIDPTKIFVGGASAGSIAALEAAYVDNVNEDPNLTATFAANGGYEGNTDLPGNPLIGTYTSTGIAGVINIAGAVLDTAVIDSNDPPVYSAQGSLDEVIPYQSGGFATSVNTPLGQVALTIPVTFYGAQAITTRATNIGLRSLLLTIPGGDHASPGMHPTIDTIVAQSSAFMQSIICGSAAPLPVTLINFTVRGQNCAAVLNWQTATEWQSSHYDVERSEDGVHFTKLASVPSKNAGNGAAYTYRIDGATTAAWYRLKMVDIDGKATYSPAQRLTPQCNSFVVRVYPNPAQASATVSGLEANQFVALISANGKLLWSQKTTGSILQIPLSTVEKGLLLVQVKDENGRVLSSTKLVKN